MRNENDCSYHDSEEHDYPYLRLRLTWHDIDYKEIYYTTEFVSIYDEAVSIIKKKSWVD